MIKNILYSLLLHSILGATIYANFHAIIKHELADLKEGISVSIAGFEYNKKPAVTTKSKVVKSEEKAKIISKTDLIKEKPTEKKSPLAQNKPSEHKRELLSKKEIEPEKKSITKKTMHEPIKKASPAPIKLAQKKDEFKLEEKIEEKIIEEKTEKIIPKTEEKPEESMTETIKENIEETNIATASTDHESMVESLENLNLSAREKYNIHSQLGGCYHRALENDTEEKISVTIKINVLKDGTLEFDLEKIIDYNRYNNPKETAYRKMMDNIVQTLELCSPIRNLPLDKYDIWKEFTIKFGNDINN